MAASRAQATAEVVDIAADGEQMAWGSDVIAAMMRRIGLKYVSVSPGSSFRGLHESLVNYLGNQDPEMLLTIHEEHCAAIAHGYAKAAEEPMGVVVHSNVGLMHTTMSIYNAWCDRVPMVVIGGIGPIDSVKRGTPIDWMHSVADQGALVRDYVKWDDHPLSVKATVESLLRAGKLTNTAPKAPVYITINHNMQEEPADDVGELPDAARFKAPTPALPDSDAVREAAALLANARNPVILAGRVSRSEDAWAMRIKLAETLGAVVFSDYKVGAAFPSDHPLHPCEPDILGVGPEAGAEMLRQADVVLALDWWDLATPFRHAWADGPVTAKVIRFSVDLHNHRGWSRDHQGLVPVDIDMLAEPDRGVPLLLAEIERIGGKDLREKAASRAVAIAKRRTDSSRPTPKDGRADPPMVWDMAEQLFAAKGKRDVCLIRTPLRWPSTPYPMRHPMDYLGYDGGAGIGSGPGMSVGAALALRGGDRLAVAVLGDGDFLMGATALWSASHHDIPLLVVVANDTSFYNDYLHQLTVSRRRNRSTESATIGQMIDQPDVDIIGLGRAQGFDGTEPIRRRGDLAAELTRGLAAVEAGGRYIIDVRIGHPEYPDR